MNTRTNKTILLIILMICLATAVYSAVGTFTFRTSGASDTTEVVDLRYPQKVPEDSSVTTDSIADGSITNDKLAEPVSVANGGTGKTTAAEALAALGGASLNGSSTVEFNALSYLTSTKREHSIFVGNMAPTGTATYVFMIISNAPVSAITEVCGYESGEAVHYYRDISTFYVTAGESITNEGKSVPDDIGVGTITVAWMWKGVNRIQVVITNNSDSILYDISVAISFVSTRASQLMRVN
jgi:hypothetical protein